MSGSHITKRVLADAIKELMVEIPMEKIKIGDIVNHCNMNRQSFYYHFKDKYDLVNWIFYTEFVTDLQSSIDKQGWERLEYMCQFFYHDQVFYSNALRVKGQNSLAEYLNKVIYTIVYYDMESYFKEHENQDFCATFLTDAICTSVIRWLLEGTKITPKEFVRLIKLTTDSVTNRVLNPSNNDK